MRFIVAFVLYLVQKATVGRLLPHSAPKGADGFQVDANEVLSL
jgi:hypothetical protein